MNKSGRRHVASTGVGGLTKKAFFAFSVRPKRPEEAGACNWMYSKAETAGQPRQALEGLK
ncbi:hypothetical protein HMPREF9372_2409 [Sporosarcina newyorkensis 2681]|uniref:Uncharacterized protein n=1 Tax=Sporosarcina newyorkensis 2681 TaxID=1027292 RepID=F9DUC8_9BACL|nr:hypothetical protein HMPREF9372_2409 [Sporosarcina newyorkensis 2681]